MAEFDDIQRLMRLKRYEQPPEGFMDDFMVGLHQRQRADLLKQSAHSLLWERFMTFLHGRPTASMAMAGVTVLALAASVALWSNMGSPGATMANAKSRLPLDGKRSNGPMLVDSMMPLVLDSSMPAEQTGKLSPLLLSKHFAGGYADEMREFGADPLQGRPSGPMEVMPGLIFSTEPLPEQQQQPQR